MQLNKLRPYQKTDAAFLISVLREYGAAGCFNQQRTGKTPTVLAVITMLDCRHPIIVTTKSGLYQWRSEFIDWIDMPAYIANGTMKHRLKMITAWGASECCALIIAYDTLKQTAIAKGCVQEILAQKPDFIAPDESHKIKNRRSDRAAALSFFKHIKYKLALTGTLAPGKQIDMFGTLNFLFPDRFHSYWGFVEEYFFTSKNINNSGQTYVNVLSLKPDKELELQEFLNKVSTNRKRKDPDVMPWLPEKDYQPVRLPLTKEQLKYIDELETIWETEHIITKTVLDRLMRYRQVCLAPELLGLKGNSPKLEWVLDYLKENPDRPTLIFTKFTSFIHILQRELKDVGVIVGETPDKQRHQLKKEFQSGKRNQLIIQIDCGKEVLTLDRAEVEIFTDKYPPIGDIEQAEDRFVSTTEDRKDKPHIIFELMMKGSYDEHIYKMLKNRKSETEVVNSYKFYLERRKQPNVNRR